jgi:transcriptional regulator with XRE-family HTH domain
VALLEILKEQRRQCGYTQAELATKLGKIQQYVSKYESRERRLDVIELMDIAVALDSDIASLLRRVTMLTRRR